MGIKYGRAKKTRLGFYQSVFAGVATDIGLDDLFFDFI